MRKSTNFHEVKVLRPAQRHDAAQKLLVKSRRTEMPRLTDSLLSACLKTINNPRPQDALADSGEVPVLIYQRTAIKLATYPEAEQSHLFAILDNGLHEFGWHIHHKDSGNGEYANRQPKEWLVLRPLSVFVTSCTHIDLDQWEHFGLVDSLYMEQLKEDVCWELGKRFLIGIERRWAPGSILFVSFARGNEGKGELLLLERDGKCHQYLLPGSPRYPIDKIMGPEAFKHLTLTSWSFPADA